MKKAKLFLFFAFFVSLLTFNSCKTALISGGESDSDVKYGRLIVSSSSVKSSSRASVTDIDSFDVYVTSSDFKKEIKATCNTLQNGKGVVEIDQIPVGKNRIISAYPKDADGNLIDSYVRRAVIDINEGDNYCEDVSKYTSCRGNVYNALLAAGVDVSSITSNYRLYLENIIPSFEDCGGDLCRLDLQSLVDDYKIDPTFAGKQASNYVFPDDEKYVTHVYISETIDSTKSAPVFAAKAVYSDETTEVITTNANTTWLSSDETIATVKDGVLTLLKPGTTQIRVKFKDEAVNNERYSPIANIVVSQVAEDSDKVFLYTGGKVNYAKDNAVVLAWIWNEKAPGAWYELEEYAEDPDYLWVQLPLEATNIIFARGKSYNSSYPTVWDSLSPCWNQTDDLDLPDLSKSNVFSPAGWDNASGTWVNKILGNQDAAIYAAIEMEPSEDDSTLSCVTVNDASLPLSKFMSYTVPYETENICVSATPNYDGASVDIDIESVSSSDINESTFTILSTPGSYIIYTITVTAKDGLNTSEYTLKVRRSAIQSYNSDANKRKCYIEDTENETITFVCDPVLWTSITNPGEDIINIRGSFTANYNESTKKWVENESIYTMSWDSNYNWYYLTLSYDKIKRPGYSGQPEYRFYYGTMKLSLPEEINNDYVFESNQNLLVFFDEIDDETRIAEVKTNGEKADYIAEESEFDLENDKAKVSNFRQVPRTKNLYRSYHPFYPSHVNSPLEDERLLSVQSYFEEYGIKSDINLCNNRTTKKGLNVYISTYVGDTSLTTTNWTIIIPEYYQALIDNNSVLYVGDTYTDSSANGYIPTGKLVYYHSDSKIFGQWFAQICNYINTHEGPYSIHCEIGIDRTGVFSAVLAGLCGASWTEIKEDYEKSNLMQIAEFRDSRILKYSLENMLKVPDIEKIDLSAALKNYFANYVDSADDIDNMVNNLTK